MTAWLPMRDLALARMLWILVLLVAHAPSSRGTEAPFLRGDATEDGVLEIADVTRILEALFRGNATSCEDAHDVDDSGALDITDPIHLLHHLLLGGEPPARPAGTCGADLTPDSLDCQAHAFCLPGEGPDPTPDLREGERDRLVIRESRALPGRISGRGRARLLKGGATSILAGEPVSGEITATTQVDSYTLEVKRGSRVVFDFLESSDADGLSWSVEDVWGREVAGSTTGLQDLGPVHLLGGDYRVDIFSRNNGVATYAFRWLEIEEDSVSPLPTGELVEGAIDVDSIGRRDVYTFSLAAGSSIFLELVSTDQRQLTWELTESSGRVVLPSRRLANEGPLPLIGGDLEYRLAIEGPRSGVQRVSGNYQFRVIELGAPAESAFELGEIVEGEIPLPGEQDLHFLTLASPTTIYFDVLESTNSFRINLQILDPLGREVLARTTSLLDQGPLRLREGLHEFRILSENGGTGTYRFRVTEIDPPITSVQMGEEISGEFLDAAPGEEQIFEFEAAPGQQITLELIESSNQGRLDYQLDDARGRTILPLTTSLATVGPLALVGSDLTGGPYRLRIRPEGDSLGTYRVLLRDDGTAGFTPTGAPLSPGVEEAVEIPAPGTEVSYTLNLDGPRDLYLDLLEADANLDWELLDPAGQSVELRRLNSTDSSDIGPIPLTAGEHTLVFRPRDDVSTPTCRFRVLEASVERQTATLDQTLSGSFAGQAGSVHEVEIDVPAETSVFLDRLIVSTRLQWALLDPVGTPVLALRRNDRVDDDQGPFSLLPGTYTLVLDPQFGYEPDYELVVRSVSLESTAISLATPISGSFEDRAGATLGFTFELVEPSRIFIDRAVATTQLNWSLLDSVGHPVFGPVRADRNDADEGPLDLASGIYELVLDPLAGHEPDFDFQIFEVFDPVLPLEFEVPVEGQLTPGGTRIHEFEALEGERYWFELTQGDPELEWSLVDELGEAVILEEPARNPGDSIGPRNLTAGVYRLILDASGSGTPAYSFTARRIEVDLEVEDFFVDRRTIFEGEVQRELTVSWQARNLGGGPALAPPAVDSLILSIDGEVGNEDDIVLDEVLRVDSLAPRQSYARSVTVALPPSLEVGAYQLHLVLDSGNEIVEPGGEDNNRASLRIEVVEDLPPAEPDFVRARTFPFEFELAEVSGQVDVPLDRPVSLDSIRYVHVEGIRIEVSGRPQIVEVPITVSLLSGRDEVLEISEIRPYTERGTATFSARFSRRLSPQTVALLPLRVVDGIRFHHEQPSGITTTISPLGEDGRLPVIFVGCEFSPCGPHVERLSPLAETQELAGTGASPWQALSFEEPVSGDGLRFISGPFFSGTTIGSRLAIGSATSEVQLILDDGSLVTLDDSRSPSTLETPQIFSLSTSHSLLLENFELAGRQITGLQWRIQASVVGLGGITAIYEPVDGMPVRFLYEVEACRGEIAIPPVDLRPVSGSAFEPGSRVTLSGQALAPEVGRPVHAVLVNGEAVDGLDAAGRFFKTVTVEEGENFFAIEVVEPGCGNTEALLRLDGIPDGATGLDSYAPAGALLEVEYEDTTFRRDRDEVSVRARVRNASRHAVRGPVLLVLAGLTPSVTPRAAAGVTEGGEPFVVLLEEGLLAPGEAGPFVTLPFVNPDRVRLDFRGEFLVPQPRPIQFEVSPPVLAEVGAELRHEVIVSSPDGGELAFRLDAGPPGMELDPVTGVLTFLPVAGDLGAHDISITVENGLGGEATRRWTLSVVESLANRPPHFTSLPALQAGVGSLYSYRAEARDPEGQTLLFTLLEGPAGMSLEDESGQVSWGRAVPGEHAVSIEVRDPEGSFAVQTFLLAVGSTPSNPSGPRITTSPGVEAIVGLLYLYQPVASDPDGDPLSFELIQGPEGLQLDPVTGRLEWTPGLDQAGSHPVEFAVEDGRGGQSRQAFTVVVRDEEFNLPPVIESVPPTHAVAGVLLLHLVDAIDLDGDAVTFGLEGEPSGMVLEAASGELEWTPTADQAGEYLITLLATDSRGATGRQTFQLRVVAENSSPSITSVPPAPSVLAGTTWQHDLDAGDPDGDLLRYQIVRAPAAMTVQSLTGLFTWRTTAADVGLHDITLAVTDCCGGRVETSFSLEVIADVTPPVVEVGFFENPIDVGATTTVAVSASDDAVVVSRRLVVECGTDPPREIPLDALGRASFTGSETGYCVCTADVVDSSGNETIAVATLQVGEPEDPLDPHPPVVTIHAPTPASIVTEVVEIFATITDATEEGQPGSGPLTWAVELAEASSGEFMLLAEGAGEIERGPVAVLDPTILPNGIYLVRITGNDGVQTGGIEFEISVAGELKMGNYRMGFVDLQIPLAGIPIAISRRYDSLDTSPGDFGAGWHLGLAGEVEDQPEELATGQGLVDLLGKEPIYPGARVYVTRPDGRRVGFTFQARSSGGLTAFVWFPEFIPDPGVEDTLEVVEPAGGFFLFGGKANQVGVPYNPTVYRLRTPEGVHYVIHEEEGLRSIEDVAGNLIEVREDGLYSSTGPAVLFERDGLGRIERIVESSGEAELRYEYDAAGNLIAFTNQADETVRYHYENPAFPHHVTRIDDLLGGAAVRTVLDDQGRLVAQCGPGGDIDTLEGCQVYDHDPGARVQTVFDAEGHRRDRLLDARGNLLTEQVFLDPDDLSAGVVETRLEYDANDRLTRWILPGEGEWGYTYDERGNLLSVADPGGRSLEYTYDECDEVATERGFSGDLLRFERDENCDVERAINEMGSVTGFTFDTPGGRLEISESSGDHWSFTFDARGLPATTTDPRGATSMRVYGRSGEMLNSTDRAGRRVEFTYDDAHRILTESWDTVPPRVIRREYDGAGLLSRVEDPDSVLTLGYHPTGHIASEDNAGTPGVPRVLLEYEYTGNGQLREVRDSLGGITTYEYDALGRLVMATQSGAGVNPRRVDFEYDEHGRRSAIRRSGDLEGENVVATTLLGYGTPGDPGRLSSLITTGAGGEGIASLLLERDDGGRITRSEDAEGVHEYDYDALGALLAARHPAGGVQPDESYLYDSIGSRIGSHLFSEVTLGRDTGAGGSERVRDDRHDYEYDGEGNLSRRIDRDTGEVLILEHDHRNRLVAAELLEAGGATLHRVTYVYDAANRRITTTTDGVSVHTVYQGHQPVLVLDDQGRVLIRRFYGLSMDEILAEEVDGETRWLLTDPVNTVRDVLDGTGAVLAHHVYDSFGRLLSTTGDPEASSLGFQARPRDPVTGLLDFRARNYDPETGRFISEDPLAPYRYRFALNNPLLYSDPTGKSVAIEYACLATNALFIGLNFGANVAKPVGELFEEIATALETLTPPPGGGSGVNGVLGGLGNYIGGPLGFTPPTDPTSAAVTAGRFALGLFCAEAGASGDAARAQGKAAAGGRSGFSSSGFTSGVNWYD